MEQKLLLVEKEMISDYPLEWYCEHCGICTQWNNSGGWCYAGGDGKDFCPFENQLSSEEEK